MGSIRNKEKRTHAWKTHLRLKAGVLVCLYLLSVLPVPYLESFAISTAEAAEAEYKGAEQSGGISDAGGAGTGNEEDTAGTGTADQGGSAGTGDQEDTAGTGTADQGGSAGTGTADQGGQTGTDTGDQEGSAGISTEIAPAPAVFNTKVKKLTGGKFVKKGKWYYYRRKNGKYALNGLYKIKKKIYYLDSKGRRRFGWKKIDGVKYYFGKSRQGWMHCSTWAKIGGKRYYFDASGRMAKGWQVIDGKEYYFKKSGAVCTTSKKKDGVRWYFNSRGEATQAGASLNIASPCGLIMEVKSGKIIYAKNPDLTHANASTTKIMTAILALENARLTDTVKVSAYAASMEPTKLGMVAGDSFKLEDLLYSLLVASGNDTAVALAEHVSGSVSRFAAKMNKKAGSLGCTNTHFVTPNGLDAGLNHYTTARDLAKIARYALRFSKFRQVVGTSTYSLRSNLGRGYSVGTTNALLNNMAYVKGIKTGYTRKAGYCFVGLITGKSGEEYITVDLGAGSSSQRWADARTLLSYAYAY